MPADAVDGHTYLKNARRLVDELLERYIPSEETEPGLLHAAMRYSVMAGGKRIRPILALASYEYSGGDLKKATTTIHPAMAALEVVHTYSLIHDDLPCMDDDDLRRGRPTCHRKFGEAMAVLAGDALHVVGFKLMAKTGCMDAVAELANAVGTSGMLGGQVADLEAEGRKVSQSDVVKIHTRKTGALIRGSVRIGALLAGTDEATLAMLTTYGERVGLAFQIIDDILDIEGDQKTLGKEIGSDSKKQKATYPGAVGLLQARQAAAALIDEALDLFEDRKDNIMKFIARYIGQREN